MEEGDEQAGVVDHGDVLRDADCSDVLVGSYDD